MPRQLRGVVVAMEGLSVSGRRKTCSAGHWTATCVLHALEFWTRSSFSPAAAPLTFGCTYEQSQSARIAADNDVECSVSSRHNW
jgi:hypothetical protein